MEELKPCPFCGSEAKVFHDMTSDYERHWNYSVDCQDDAECGASVTCFDEEKEAIAAWNKRTIWW